MIPYLHLGPLPLPTFGMMVALALITSAYILQWDFDRRKMKADAFLMITFAGIAGIVGAKIYHLVDSPADRWMVFSRYGFAWFGGFLGGFGTMLVMGWQAKLPTLEFLDACSPAASFGYAIGRIGCFLSGDGDYGKPTSLPWGMSFPNGVVPTTERVHPTPLYEFFIWCAIGALLWYLGGKWIRGRNIAGRIFCLYLILTGVARYLVEIIRINPPWILGLSNAQVASLASAIAGVILLLVLKSNKAQRA
ncbi:MAG TPA: prolipoprotein diacylglyceryl transferase family protein [Dongiaceae bacterium]|nr:prolipoprotein diacylglyceryl transferase family protein [Dongiaceae bacterium]